MSLLTACLYISDEDIRMKARAIGINSLSRSDMNKIKDHLRSIAQAWAGASLQDADKSEFEYWLSEDEDE